MRAKLRTKAPKDAPPRVDRETGNGVLFGVSIISAGPALGHGFDIDGVTLDQAVELAEGVPGRWTHGNLCGDGLGTHLGRWRDVRREGHRVLGDFHFSPNASKVQPEGLSVDAPTYLMDLAETEPDVAGVSVVIDYELAEAEGDADLAEKPEAGDEVGDDDEEDEDEGKERPMVARLTGLSRADYVADPAANPSGLFSGTPSELAERATESLMRAESAYGRERVVGFLRSYLSEGSEESGAEELTAENAKLRARVAELEKAAKDRRQLEIDDYIATLSAASAEVQKPIAAAELGEVRELFELGKDEAARKLGAALLKTAKLEGGKPFQRAPRNRNEDSKLEQLKRQVAAEKAQLEGGGWAVTLNEDETKVISAVRGDVELIQAGR